VTSQRNLDRHERVLRAIENRVLEDVRISTRWRVVGGAVAVIVAAMAIAWWIEAIAQGSPHAANPVPAIAVAALVIASVVSVLALGLQRYRWCCAASYGCGLGAVAGIGAFWWVRTGRAGIGLQWLVLADLAAVILTLGWLAVIVTPIERSQPDMRRCSVCRQR